jgi:cytochrome P450
MHTDPPDHTRVRALVNRLFTPRSVELLGPRIEALANDLLDEAVGSRAIDLVAEFALPLSSRVVSDVLGVPLEHTRLRDWIENSQSFLSGNALTPALAARMEATLVAARTFIAETAARRRADPQDDLISRLVTARDEGALTDDELLSTCMTFILGAYMTTTALISSAVLALLRHPSELARMLSNGALVATAIEEVLRYESPAPRVTRIASDAVDLEGQQIARGDSLILMLGAANRDPDVFPEPARFDVARRANRHLAFAAGAHFCAGAPLARLEGASALRVLFQRFPRTALAGGFRPAWVANPSIRLVERLPVNLV